MNENIFLGRPGRRAEDVEKESGSMGSRSVTDQSSLKNGTFDGEQRNETERP